MASGVGRTMSTTTYRYALALQVAWAPLLAPETDIIEVVAIDACLGYRERSRGRPRGADHTEDEARSSFARIGFVANEISDLNYALEGLAFGIREATVVIDARHAFDVTAHGDDPIGSGGDAMEAQSAQSAAQIDVLIKQRSKALARCLKKRAARGLSNQRSQKAQ
jgi:hypothetical protein